MIMKNPNYVAGYSGIGILIRRACRWKNSVTYQDFPGNTEPTSCKTSDIGSLESYSAKIALHEKPILHTLISRKFHFWRAMEWCFILTSTSVARKIFVITGFSLLSACATGTPPSHFTHSPNPSSSDTSMRLENSPLETGYAENASGAGPERGYGGENRVSRIAKAYLDHTFFSRRTEKRQQGFQGRTGITNKTTQADYRNTPKLRGRLIQGSPLSSTGRFQASSLDTWLHNDPEYQGNNGFTASLEWQFSAPGFADKPAFDNLTWGDVLKISFFADYGSAFSNSMPLTNVREHELGIGTGLQFLLPGRFTANLQAAYPLNSWERDGDMTNGEKNPDSNRTQYWFFDFSYNF
uniref:Uncharacterized protein n=1 Tax=Candidatus Kentrum sp. SD TaxID=2126332 RepID=A0A450Y8S7_9GAMM|nr:MAG: hypothetical protein BECKSD772F_GA0070984_101912 [Candidatus Kentron sp. SD]VFK42570.1 MAG: hypothetical protein BECKSD772E_GA0070983_101813 [Candidatus Kentron sp. SD]